MGIVRRTVPPPHPAMPSAEDVQRLVTEAEPLPNGPAKIALLDEAARIADTLQDDEAGFLVRRQLVTAANFGGQPDLMLVAFVWCLSKLDANPDGFGGAGARSTLLWQFKWVISTLAAHHTVPRAQVLDTLDDMRRRFVAEGHSLHRIHDTERRVRIAFGDKAGAAAAFDAMVRTRPDGMSECDVCVKELTVSYYRYAERHAEAVAVAEEYVARNLNCEAGPMWVCAYALEPLVRLGQAAKAERYYRLGYPRAAFNPGYIGAAVTYLEYLALVGNLKRAGELFRRHFPVGLGFANPMARLNALRVGRLYGRRLAQAGQTAVAVSLPPPHPLATDAGSVPLPAFLDWVDAECARVAALYDARNGNATFGEDLNRDLAKLDEFAALVG
jgi:hypothetical protein